jgi:3'-5' exonuclease
MNLFLDIETIGTEDQTVIDEITAGITPPGNISKAETITAWEVDKKPGLIEEAIKRSSFDGGLGRVICVGFALDNDYPQALTGSEPDIFRALTSLVLHSPQVIGHNVGWDVRFLWQRFVVNAISPPGWLRTAVKAKPWEVADTMLLWNPDREKRTSLDKLCRILGVPISNDPMDGSKVWHAYNAGEIAKIADYCCGDVRVTRDCYRRMTA